MITADILQPLIDAAEWVITLFAEGASPIVDFGLSWGLAIVALTFVTRLLILPLSIKQIRSMRSLQAFQPQIKEVQERYKDDKERQQREMIALYREHGINPLASCWPLLLQLPVFIALYQLLRGTGPGSFAEDVTMTVAAGTNTESFLFVSDILVKPTGVELVLLIVLFIVTQLAAGLVMATRLEGPQRYIMFAFPVLIAPFIITQPAGLAVYWISTNIWTLGQQFVVQRFMPAPELPTPEEVKAARPPPPPPRKKKRRR